MQISPVTRRSLDQLEDEMISLSQRINVSEYDFLVLVREFDIRQGWRAWHFNNCAEWLNMKCGISLGTAREKVRVALALFDLPLCSKAFASGSLSYSKARAMTRYADHRNEQELLDYSLKATASQVEDHCHQLRNGQRRVSTIDANRAYRERKLSRIAHPDGTMTINMELPKELGDLVMKAIDVAMVSETQAAETKITSTKDTETDTSETKPTETNISETDARKTDTSEAKASETYISETDTSEAKTSEADTSETETSETSFVARQADALVQIARAYLSTGWDKESDKGSNKGSDKKASTANNHQLIIHVDESALHDKGGKSDLPIESVRRLACDTDIVEVTKDKKGNLLNLGRKHRVVSPQLKKALVSRDKSCCFPGCSHDKWLDAHHVMHWVDGGETNPTNTLLLCSAHHRLLHEGGYSIHKNFADAWYFRNSNGKVIPDSPEYKPEEYNPEKYNPEKYDASRDGFVANDCVSEPQACFTSKYQLSLSSRIGEGCRIAWAFCYPIS